MNFKYWEFFQKKYYISSNRDILPFLHHCMMFYTIDTTYFMKAFDSHVNFQGIQGYIQLGISNKKTPPKIFYIKL